MRLILILSIVSLACLGCLASATATAAPEEARRTRPSLFDPSRHMRVSEVKPGMKGYGLSVFRGITIDRFDVEVQSILRNFNPKQDVVLIRCSGANLEHSGAVGGMSGSPIFLTDEQGRQRMIGALAYGWPLLKDPLAGVQPIEYMLEVAEASDRLPVAASQPALGGEEPPGRMDRTRTGADARGQSSGPLRWSIGEVFPLPGQPSPAGFPVKNLTNLQPNPEYFKFGSDRTRLQPLASPLMVGGVPSELLDAYSPLLRAYGLTPLQAGGAGGSPKPEAADTPVRLEPGATLAVPLVTGDVDFTLIGTVTEVIDDRVIGFGHPFLSEGPISLPMGLGEINGILAKLDQSQKLGNLRQVVGALTGDQTVGVAGRIGQTPQVAPIELRVAYSDGSQDQTYRYNCAIHPRLTPFLSGLALASSISGRREPPQYHTIKYDLKMEFSNGQVVECTDIGVNSGKYWPLEGVVVPLMAASQNPFEPVTLSKLSGSVVIVPEAQQAEILSVQVPRLKYKPGETIKAFVNYRPFCAPEAIFPIELQLPHDLTDGTYQLVVSGWERFVGDEQLARPFRFTAENVDEVFAVLRELMSFRHDALYVRLLRQPDGVAVGRVAMPRLPSSRRQILLGSGRSNTTPFVSSTVKIIPTQLAIDGSADFAIEIDAEERVETPSGKIQKADQSPSAILPGESTKAPKPGRLDPPGREVEKPDKSDRDKPEQDNPDKPDKPDVPRSDDE